jgi:hypothetical protein
VRLGFDVGEFYILAAVKFKITDIGLKDFGKMAWI